jgi:hypothetical protein
VSPVSSAYHGPPVCGAAIPFDVTALNPMASQYATPQQLDAMLGALEHDLPALVAAHPSPSDFWDAFMRRVDPIEESAAADSDTVLPRINAMLAPYGMRIAAVE